MKGTTLRVYRFLFSSGSPASARDVQRGLGLSSPSVAEYHLKKLVEGGLVRDGPEGFVVDRVVWRNMIRMRRTLIPFQAVYSIFFGAALATLVVFWDIPEQGYLLGVAIALVGLGISLYETTKALSRSV